MTRKDSFWVNTFNHCNYWVSFSSLFHFQTIISVFQLNIWTIINLRLDKLNSICSLAFICFQGSVGIFVVEELGQQKSSNFFVGNPLNWAFWAALEVCHSLLLVTIFLNTKITQKSPLSTCAPCSLFSTSPSIRRLFPGLCCNGGARCLWFSEVGQSQECFSMEHPLNTFKWWKVFIH